MAQSTLSHSYTGEKMFNPATFARLIKKYFEDHDLCLKCGGSLKCCHEQKDNDA
jgi:rRNA maturation endonuclease Nob1